MDSITFHPSKNYIKASLDFTNVNTESIPDNIIIPFFIDYSSSYPFALFMFQKTNENELDFIQNNSDISDNKSHLSSLLDLFYIKNCSITHRNSCFYELSNNPPLELNGTFCDNSTFLWLSTQYELYNSKTIYNIPFNDDVLSFFDSNPHLNQLLWNNTNIPTPIVAYSIDTLKNSIFQSTFGSKRYESEPYYSLCNYHHICNILNLSPHTNDNTLGIVRYSLFEPFTISTNKELESDDDILYSFSEHTQHTPLCYFKV